MQTIRVYDPDRSPQNWREVLRPGQFAAFSTHLDSEAPCDPAGMPFAAPDATTCVVFDSLPEAAGFCRAGVEQAPNIRFDIFDSAGRVGGPILTVVHPSREDTLVGNRRSTRMSHSAAAALVIAGPILIWVDWAKDDGLAVVPTIVGLNCLVFGVRLFALSSAYASTERLRRERLAQHVEQRKLGP